MNIEIKQRIENIIKNVEQLPSIPDVVTKIINMVNDPDVSFKEMSLEISRDQAITTNLLKLCNSAYFSKGKEITSVDRAVVTLGLKEVKDIIIVATTRAILSKPVIGYDLEMGELWRHGLAVAMLAKNIALAKGGKAIADTVFTGGIIHDVGKTVLALHVKSALNEILERVEQEGISFQNAERDVMGFDHQQLGDMILAKWNFPDVLKAIVGHHHEPEGAEEKYRKEVSIVHVANVICLMAGVGIGSDGLYHELSGPALRLAGLGDEELEQLYAQIPEMMQKAREIL